MPGAERRFGTLLLHVIPDNRSAALRGFRDDVEKAQPLPQGQVLGTGA
jgi:hypothetical protein